MDIFATMVSHTTRAFRVDIETETFFKNLQNNNKEFSKKTSQAEKATKKAKTDVEATQK